MGDALFVQFVFILLDKGTLSRGDLFIINSYSIHLNGDKIGLQVEFFQK